MTTTPISIDKLCWKYIGKALSFETTDELRPGVGVFGQDEAIRAIEFSLQCKGRQQNAYVRGLPGVGRQSLVNMLLKQKKLRQSTLLDRCYVHNFKRQDRPRLITLPAGKSPLFKSMVRDMVTGMEEELSKSLNSKTLLDQRGDIQHLGEKQVKALFAPFEEELEGLGLQLVQLQSGETAIFIKTDEGPVPPAQYSAMVKEGKGDDKTLKTFEKEVGNLAKKLITIQQQTADIYQKVAYQSREVNEQAARSYLSNHLNKIVGTFPGDDVKAFINEVINDVVENRLNANPDQPLPAASKVYDVNIVLEQTNGSTPPVIHETLPNLGNLLGSIDPEWLSNGQYTFSYHGITAGSLLRADGGYLVLDASDVLSEPGAWRSLMRTIRTGKLEIVPPELGMFGSPSMIKPEPISLNVRVILIGDAYYYYQLDQFDSDFSELFKVLADFDNELSRDASGIKSYAHVIARICQDNDLTPFSRDAVIRVIEHGSRIASRANKITAKFGRIADICQEASYIAERTDSERVDAAHVQEAIDLSRQRAGLPSRKFRDMVNSGTIRIETDGETIGQVNGLAVIRAGVISYGFPARITSTIAPGRAGLINIEATANLSGSIHTKGFNILGGVLRHLLKPHHPLTFSASIAFEQSYGGIDGDSASGVEAVCLISSLTEIPAQQGIAMTGAIDQLGNIQAIGGVNEKIEGFYSACEFNGFKGVQGVIIPKANEGDLNLRKEVVDACENGQFNVWAIGSIEEALELMLGRPAGKRGKDGNYPADSILGIAVTRAQTYFDLSNGPSNKDQKK